MNSITVQNLGKKYKIGKTRHGDLRESIGSFFGKFRLNQLTLQINPPIDRVDKSKHQFNREFWALKEISFEISEGEAVGIIGRNGAGKSTLLKILSRITNPTTGRLEINGRLSCLLEVGTGFHQELTGRENIYLNGTILGMKRREVKSKFDDIVEFSGIEKFIDLPVKHYSSGMKVRLAFSVSAHLESEIMLIDEVLAVGDIEFQKKCLGIMQNVTKQGRTIMFGSHQLDAIRKFCNRCFLIDHGELMEDNNNVDDVIQLYINGSSDSILESIWKNEKENIKNPVFIPEEIYIRSDGVISRTPLNNNAHNEVIIKG